MQERPRPELTWTEENVPRSVRFADTYFSRSDGRQETRHVFLKGNDLPQRWADRAVFRIAELGFGTGLNFLETLDSWRKDGQRGGRLEYMSFERYPLARNDMTRALSTWPEIESLAGDLLEDWRVDTETLSLQLQPDVKLQVLFGEAGNRLSSVDFVADAWYLDGFSPARNPDLWTPKLMAEVFAHTCEGGTFATYSAAGNVRRNLAAAGFQVDKVAGFATKREMLRGFRPVI